MMRRSHINIFNIAVMLNELLINDGRIFRWLMRLADKAMLL